MANILESIGYDNLHKISIWLRTSRNPVSEIKSALLKKKKEVKNDFRNRIAPKNLRDNIMLLRHYSKNFH